ncbi:hypothetical protein [Neobacillus drentensis]|uniref:hypothetical protein n=1 Tax=Neobacillus drentensis TaxID=220684 RepID=UPI003B58A5BA
MNKVCLTLATTITLLKQTMKFKKAQIDHALKLLETNSYLQVEDITGISKSTIIRAKNRMSCSDNKR